MFECPDAENSIVVKKKPEPVGITRPTLPVGYKDTRNKKQRQVELDMRALCRVMSQSLLYSVEM